MSRRGDCWDNAVAESFWETLKNELGDGRDFYTRAEAQMAVFEYIEDYYSGRRRHSAINYRSPREHEALYWQDAWLHNELSTKAGEVQLNSSVS